MKLSFHGQAYEASKSTLDGIETQQQLTFLGKHYNRKEYNVAQRSQAPQALTFRGRQYVR